MWSSCKEERFNIGFLETFSKRSSVHSSIVHRLVANHWANTLLYPPVASTSIKIVSTCSLSSGFVLPIKEGIFLHSCFLNIIAILIIPTKDSLENLSIVCYISEAIHYGRVSSIYCILTYKWANTFVLTKHGRNASTLAVFSLFSNLLLVSILIRVPTKEAGSY